eukprot:s5202_g3.t1
MEAPSLSLWHSPARGCLGRRWTAQAVVPEVWSSGGSSSSSSRIAGTAPAKTRTPWLRLGVGAGLALAAKTRGSQPRDPDLVGLSMLNKDLPADEDVRDVPKQRREDDESWVFWEEQLHPTPGLKNQPRDKIPEPLPSPLPSLEPPAPGEGDDVEDQAASFEKAYRPAEPAIMGSDGNPLEVPFYSTFEEAVNEFGYPPFLQAALARRGFYFLTPVQQCSLPLMKGGHDFLASAFTGSGKTAAYLLPILKSLHEVSRLVPGTSVASHYKTKDNSRSAKPGLGVVKGLGSNVVTFNSSAHRLNEAKTLAPQACTILPKMLGFSSLCALALSLGGHAADAPIVGVLTVPVAHGCETARAHRWTDDAKSGGSCFASLYVKYVEAAGGRVVPILYDWDDQQLAKAFASVNAVLFTGGGVQIAHPSSSPMAAQYVRAASLLFNLTVQAGSAGDWVPLWGTCMGLQTLSVVAAGTSSVLKTNSFDSENMSLPLELAQDAKTSRLLGPHVPSNILRWLTTENITTNLHHDGVTPDSFAMNQRLSSLFSVLSTNRDRKGREFVSTIEGKSLPIYGVQWHPERPIFEWGADESGINHGPHAIEAMQYFANFLVAEARKNSHHFESKAEEESALIYNFVPQGRSSYQVYLFESVSAAKPAEVYTDMTEEMPMHKRMRGIKDGRAALEFEAATGKTHRQLVPVEWVVGAPEPPPKRRWQGPAVPKAVVLVPTRELSEQVHNEAKEFLYYSPLRSAAIYGDSNLRSQFRDLAHGADLLVATPGRLIDALHKGMIRLDEVQFLVLDEVDRMMELGFGSQLEEIVTQGAMPGKLGGRQTTFWSATIPLSVRELAEAFLGTQCAWVDCTGGQTNPVPTTISHIFVDARPPHRALREFQPGDSVITKGGRRGIAEFQVGRRWRVQFDDGDLVQRKMLLKGRLHHTSLRTDSSVQCKLETLRGVLEAREFEEATIIVFCRRRDTVMEVYRYLKEQFEGVVTCHGGMTQSFRSKSIKALKEGSADILVATDIAARGLDVESITHVVNYELPLVLDEFVHRIGRTGRIGREGTAVTFVTGREKIFGAMRRMVLSQGHKVPDWLNFQGLQLAWRPRNYKLPFTKVRKGIPQDAPPEVRDAYMEKNRDMQRRTKSKLMTRMAELEGTPVDPRELHRRSVMIVDAAEEETQAEEDIDITDQFAEAEQPMLAMEPMEGM